MKLNRFLAIFVILIIVVSINHLFTISKIDSDELNIKSNSNTEKSNVKICENKNKYIRYECIHPYCGGWGDRLRGLMSAYTWAIFTNRTFLINVNYPCSLSLMLEPNAVKWNRPINCYDYFNNTVTNPKEPFKSVMLNKTSDRKFYLSLRDINIFEYQKEANLITIRNNLDWIYSFKFNKHLNHSIYEFGYTPDTFRLPYFFRKLYTNLFKLTPKLEKIYNKFIKQAKPDNATTLICAQIRIGGARPNVKFDAEFMPRNNSKLFWSFIRESILNVSSRQKFKLFVTTDTENVEFESIEEFGKENIVNFDGPFVHIDRERIGNINDCSRVEKVILDFHAIQLCDVAIISQSGFGRLGIANRINPAKDLYQLQKIIGKKKSKTGGTDSQISYSFKKIEDLSKL